MNVGKVIQIAWREFTTTVLTKAFLFGLLFLPLMMVIGIAVVPWLTNLKSPPVTGTIAIVDPSGELLSRLTESMSREALLAKREALNQRLDEVMPGSFKSLRSQPGVESKLQEALGDVPNLKFRAISLAALDAEKELLKQPKRADQDNDTLQMILVVDANAVTTSDGSTALGGYRAFEREVLDSRFSKEVRDGMRQAIVDARLSARQLNAADIRALMEVPRPEVEVVSAKGTENKNEVVRMLLPIAFMMLIFISVMAGGQQLMTSTIEEKSSRVVEVLLAAVSPLELMTGKIIGQMAVGALMMGVYGGLLLIGLATFSLVGLISVSSLVYLCLFFVLSATTVAALMAAIGAAVNEIREAQSLLTPVMLLLILPMMLMGPVMSDPNGGLATVVSLVPPASPYVMMMRLSSNVPPPVWQILLALLLNAVAAVMAVWFAGKVFRIGLLMYGKPPNLLTLWRWVRMA
ncbi:hypothetical protein C7S18_03435 [Ahniella affigens]|uniref:ABC-2 type transporter transmembrane domain-containing protein n=1 Tax=Ahniella affigens TaxID=2021234 RepID=A0A2P1PN90_9GAMM|nr:ABC transporter permease [Ahniella affigens]AVP96298.1 hypothetical protein C7S18_03435 [Ahniella affigens]